MMGRTHRATGLAAGAVVAGGLRVAVLPPPAPVSWSVVGVLLALLLTQLCGRASMWPDLDHENSTATHSYGLVTAWFSELVHATSCRVFDLTATELDEKRGNFRGHRGLSHTGLAAIVTGFLLGAVVWTLTSRHPIFMLGCILGLLVGVVADRVLTDLVGSIVGLIAAVVVWYVTPFSLPVALGLVAAMLGVLIGTVLLGTPLGAVLGVAFGAGTMIATPSGPIDWTLVASETAMGVGLGTGLVATVGMLAHDLGDAATKTGVPLLWPLLIKGQRFYPIHIRPEGHRIHTGKDEYAELRLRVVSRVLVGLAVLAWWPGLLPTVWALIPWPGSGPAPVG